MSKKRLSIAAGVFVALILLFIVGSYHLINTKHNYPDDYIKNGNHFLEE